jgi:peptidyl-prolyl cis-trans isomerase C
MKRSFLIPVLMCCAPLAWSQTPPAPPASAPPPAAPAAVEPRGPDAVAKLDPNKVVATIDGKPITAKEALDMINSVPQYRQQYGNQLQALLQQLYTQKEWSLEAQKLNLDKQEPYKARLEMTRNNILANAYVEHLKAVPLAADQDPKKYYDAHVADFDQARVSAILVGFVAPGTPSNAQGPAKRTEEEARAKVSDLEKKLHTEGVDFSAVAKTESDNPSLATEQSIAAGATGLPPDIKTAVFKLKANEISEPVRMPSGFLIFKVISRETQTFDQAKAEINKKLQDDRVQQEAGKYRVQVQDPNFFGGAPGPTASIPSLARPSAPPPPAQR